jgi:hypothetical protein
MNAALVLNGKALSLAISIELKLLGYIHLQRQLTQPPKTVYIQLRPGLVNFTEFAFPLGISAGT